MRALVLVEYNNKMEHTALSAINAALQLTSDIELLIINNNQDLTAESIVKNINDYQYIICTATAWGKSVMPRIASLLDVEQISEVVNIITHNTFERLIYSGDAVQTVRLNCKIKCLTIRVGYFVNKDLEKLENFKQIKINNINNIKIPKLLELIKSNQQQELSTAKIVIAGGRSLQTKENFNLLIEELAKKLNAATGATRTAVYAGFAPNEWQIGFSGKTIKPDLYIAVGISGAVQHLSGIKNSKIIVAINIDEHAPIFGVADYKLVGDLFKIVPELIAVI